MRNSIPFIVLIISGLAHQLSCASLFNVGKEYKFSYETLVTTGTQSPVPFASAYKLKGYLTVSAISSTTLSVGLSDITVGLYNGPWTYFPTPSMEFSSYEDLEPLMERFHIIVDEYGKAKSLVLNDQEPEWASNMKRGLATFIQMDLNGINFSELLVTNKKELTTMGECSTRYEVLPSTTTPNQLTRINKFRNHADCPDMPTRSRLATHIFYPCTQPSTRDLMNSTAYATYEMSVSKTGEALLKQLTVFSSVLYWPFTTNGPYQYSWLNMTIALDSVGGLRNTGYGPPENAETHEDLTYVFEQSDPVVDPEDENPDLNSEVQFFHHRTVDTDPLTLSKTSEMIKKMISRMSESILNGHKTWDGDTERLHSDAPFNLLPLFGSLDYETLKSLYLSYSDSSSQNFQKQTELQLYVDALVLTGTSATTLMLRDIILTTKNLEILQRIVTSFPHFISNPTEALAKEIDKLFPVLTDEEISEPVRRMLAFSIATLVGRSCRKTLCNSTDLLDKYVNYFEEKLASGTNFEERTVALLCLRNLKIGDSLSKVLDIATGALGYEKPVRVQAIWSLSSLSHSNPKLILESLLPVFYNRSESCEVRTSVFGLLANGLLDEKMLMDVAYFMWTETCGMTSNIVRTFVLNAMRSESPCGQKMKSYAKTIYNYLPPGEVDPLKTGRYGIEYFDKYSAFGHQIYATIQKSGKAALPISLYIGLNNYIGGYGSSYFGIYIRMEGVEKAVANKVSEMRYNPQSISDIKNILSQIGVTERKDSPLYLELTLLYHDYVILHYAADEKSIEKLPAFLKKLGTFSDSVLINLERSSLLGGIFYQLPMEIGTPLSISASVATTGAIFQKIKRTKENNKFGYTQDTDMSLQFHMYGVTQITNHAPAIKTMHSIKSLRALRTFIPRHFKVSLFNILTFAIEPPSHNKSLVVMSHGTSYTSIQTDSPTRVYDELALEKLKKSCRQCNLEAKVSLGPLQRTSKKISFDTFVRDVKYEGGYFDCERRSYGSKAAILKDIRNFFSSSNKNTGIFESYLAKQLLGFSHLRDRLFILPFAETCGIHAKIYQDELSSSKLEKIEGQIHLVTSPATENFPSNQSLIFILNFLHTGSVSSSTKIKIIFELIEDNFERRLVHLKLIKSDDHLNSHGVICVKMLTFKNSLPVDILGYEGENEPFANTNIHVIGGKFSTIEDELCEANYGEFKIIGRASRSAEQKVESESDSYPYSVCKKQKVGKFSIPSNECLAAFREQVYLRNINYTINYRILKSVYDKWRRPIDGALGFLYPYQTEAPSYKLTNSESFDTEFFKSNSPSQKTENDFYEGEIYGGINVKKSGPVADIHLYSNNKEEHFEEIDLNNYPAIVKPYPVPTLRFTQNWAVAFRTGFVSFCSVTPDSVYTLDGSSYQTSLNDCWTLLAGDCGKNARFVVLGKKLGRNKIALRVQLGETKIEFNGQPNPFINGMQTNLTDRKTWSIFTSFEFELMKNGDDVHLSSRVEDVFIRYTGYFMTLSLGSRYRSVHCGLCGSWDSSPFNDLISPSSSCPSLLPPNSMAQAYSVREGNCGGGNQCPV